MIIFWILGGIAVFLLLTFVVMRLWNWLVPALFKGPVIQFRHALGLVVLSKLLFGGFGRPGFGGPGFAGRFYGPGPYPNRMWNDSTDHWRKRSPFAPFTRPESEKKTTAQAAI